MLSVIQLFILMYVSTASDQDKFLVKFKNKTFSVIQRRNGDDCLRIRLLPVEGV